MADQTINTKSSLEIENLVKRTLENVRLNPTPPWEFRHGKI